MELADMAQSEFAPGSDPRIHCRKYPKLLVGSAKIIIEKNVKASDSLIKYASDLASSSALLEVAEQSIKKSLLKLKKEKFQKRLRQPTLVKLYKHLQEFMLHLPLNLGSGYRKKSCQLPPLFCIFKPGIEYQKYDTTQKSDYPDQNSITACCSIVVHSTGSLLNDLRFFHEACWIERSSSHSCTIGSIVFRQTIKYILFEKYLNDSKQNIEINIQPCKFGVQIQYLDIIVSKSNRKSDAYFQLNRSKIIVTSPSRPLFFYEIIQYLHFFLYFVIMCNLQM
ncbi:hypothetical protein BpHYR1_016595 [Brachionus plicatilis]|uniref:Uncharacterized protein n=1 Tax=Brachionus plicatilis TaxID=10195 RepID=A0A3M7SLA9_BRAPC|nr:hypothetical protein BpHYR1_016595 [Brachionus plicatilis]